MESKRVFVSRLNQRQARLCSWFGVLLDTRECLQTDDSRDVNWAGIDGHQPRLNLDGLSQISQIPTDTNLKGAEITHQVHLLDGARSRALHHSWCLARDDLVKRVA